MNLVSRVYFRVLLNAKQKNALAERTITGNPSSKPLNMFPDSVRIMNGANPETKVTIMPIIDTTKNFFSTRICRPLSQMQR
jgi:hypothetical protein